MPGPLFHLCCPDLSYTIAGTLETHKNNYIF
jgi:hypothetical protein